MRSKILLLSLLVLFLPGRVQAAAPGIHVLFAQAWLESHPPSTENEELALIAGTLFPDIRYLGTLERKETHKKNVKIRSIQLADSAFSAGVLLHCYVDEKREAFLKKRKIKRLLKEIPKNERTKFLKVLEDEICWDQICKNTTPLAMQKTYPQESIAGEDAVSKWHHEMTFYFQQRPSELLKQLAEQNKPFIQLSPQSVKHWAEVLPRYAKEPLFIEYTKKMVESVSKKF